MLAYAFPANSRKSLAGDVDIICATHASLVDGVIDTVAAFDAMFLQL